MNNFFCKIYLLIFIFSFPIFSNEYSVMTFNVENLFDTKDDLKKNDKAFLPIEQKQSKKHKESCLKIRVNSWKNECLYLDWNIETKDAKLKNLVDYILLFENGADIIALQEVENNNILNQLYKLLEPYGYIDFVLLEGKDYRGIDNAIISKFKIHDSKLHYINFSGDNSNKDSRPILDVTINVNNKKIKIYNVHFPSGFYDVSMRIDSLNQLRKLLKSHNYPSIALGDFNINTKEDKKLKIYESEQSDWIVANLEGCQKCRGTYYYNYGNTWEYLDNIFISKKRDISFIQDTINTHITNINSYQDTGRPKSFNPKNKEGVSDHFAMVAKFQIN